MQGMNRLKRIAVVRGGEWDTTQAAPRTVRTLLAMGHSVTVLCWDLSGEGQAREVKDGVEIVRYRRPVTKAGAYYFCMWLLWWVWLIRKFVAGRYDLVHVMNVDCVVPAVMSGIICRHKIIYDIRDAWGMSLSTQRFPIPQVFTALDRIFTPFVDGLLLSQGHVEFCAFYFGRRAYQRVPVIQVLNVPEHDFGADHRTPGGAPLILNCSGRISAIRAAYMLADGIEGRKDVRMHVYGKLSDSDVRKRLESMDNVDFEGKVDHKTSMEYMDRADVISLLYDPAYKSMIVASANKMFEAMMLGKPLLCSDGNYPGEVAKRFGLGWTLPYGNVQALKDLLDRLIENPQLVVEAGRNAGRHTRSTSAGSSSRRTWLLCTITWPATRMSPSANTAAGTVLSGPPHRR